MKYIFEVSVLVKHKTTTQWNLSTSSTPIVLTSIVLYYSVELYILPLTRAPCWGPSYWIIRYYDTTTTTAAATTIDSMSSPGTSSVPSTTALITMTIGLSNSQLQLGLISLATIILAIAMVICIPVSFVLGKRSRKKNLIIPTTIPNIMVMKSEEEELPVEQAVHIQNYELPNMIQDTSNDM